jgi:hypothetical protein
MEDAVRLGLNPTHPDDLREAGEVTVADGSAIPCLSPLVPIRAQILGAPATLPAEGLDPAGDGLQPWGPIFDLDAIFVEHAIPLWGQADFFDTFGIDFQRPQFTLSY